MKNYTVLLFAVCAILFAQRCTNNQTNNDSKASTKSKVEELKPILIVDVRQIVNKSASEVGIVLGRAERTEVLTGYPCENSKCSVAYFENGKYEVIFKNGKAKRITIKKPPKLSMSKRLTESVGLSQSAPSFYNPSLVIRWTYIEGLKEVSFFNDGYDKVSYILIIVD